MLLRRAGLTASAGLSYFVLFWVVVVYMFGDCRRGHYIAELSCSSLLKYIAFIQMLVMSLLWSATFNVPLQIFIILHTVLYNTQAVLVFQSEFDDIVIMLGIPPDHCRLPLQPETPTETVDSVRFGTQPESRWEYNGFRHSVNSRYVMS